jgi:outer membrane receptor protein involved in Fe transport
MNLNLRYFLLTSIILTFTKLSFSQNISGIVTDKTQQPIIGASISLTQNGATSGGTLSDIDGKYLLNDVKSGPVKMVITAVGFKTFTADFSLTKDTTINMVMGDDALDLDAVVITGSSNPLKKLESSVAITTMSAKKIEEVAPVSTAALLKTVPGFVVESSGGEVGNNLFARGIPSAGAYEFVQMQEDGLPVFEDGALQFANADVWLRVDETISRMEAVRGGSGSIYATNAPGGIINFISKTGTNDFAGLAKLSTGTSSLYRADMNLSGALVQDKLFFNIGGFYRVDNGVRNPGYQGDRGGQLKLNLKYNINDHGSVKFFYKKLDDHNQFLLPIPLTDKDHPKGITDFDANYGTFNSVNLSQLDVPQLGGGYFTRDLTNGVHPIVDAMGGEFKNELGNGFSVSNNFRYTKIKLNYTAIFPGVEPQTAADFAAGQGITNAGYSYVSNNAVANPALVAKVGYWAVDKDMSNLANNLKFDYTNHKNLTITVGEYYSNLTSNQYWNWSNLLVAVSDKPQLLNLVDKSKASGDPNYSRTYNGVSDISFLTRQSQLRGNINAFYANIEIKATDNLTLDLGGRFDIDHYSGYKVGTTAGNLDSNNNFGYNFKTTTADNSITNLNGNYTYWTYNLNRFSGSIGANYKFDDRMAAFVRYSNGFRGPNEESFYDNIGNLSTLKPTIVNQFEVGYKLQGNNYAFFANAFYSYLNNIAFTDILANGTSENKFANSQNYGLELEANYSIANFSVSGSGTIQNPTFKNFEGSDGMGGTFNYNGNVVRRIPKFYFTLRPSYNFTQHLSAYVAWDFVGKKYSDNANVFALPAFSQFAAGVAYKIKHMRFAIDATNLTNTVGLTEGNPRITTAPGSIYYARPILGRAARASVTIDF